MGDQCNVVIDFIYHDCIPQCQTEENKAFFMKLICDFYRYASENKLDERHEKFVQYAKDSYKNLQEKYKPELKCNAISLGTILSQAVFSYECLHEQISAIKIGEKAVEDFSEPIEAMDK